MSSCPNALPSNDASPLEVPAAHNPNGLTSSIYESSRGCIWRRVEHVSSPISSRPSGTATATGFIVLTLPLLPAHRTTF